MKSSIVTLLILLTLVALALLSIRLFEKSKNSSGVVDNGRGLVGVPASGQKTPYQANKNDEIDSKVDIPDDGALQAGPSSRFVDNGDGTITDQNTGLMWEKKCANCKNLHSVEVRHHWSGDGHHMTIWDWIDEINSEGQGKGFAGYNDWRIPNVKELLSIVDYGRFDPAIGKAFHSTGCVEECSSLTDTSCSCTAASLYWTSTTFADFPAHALIVEFTGGFVDDRIKTNRHFVRAVREVP